MGSGAADFLDGIPRGLGALTARLATALARDRFGPACPHTPAAVESAVRHAVETGTAEIGDYYELGMGRGFTLWHAQRVAAALGNRTMRFVGFDSRAGAPGEGDRLGRVRDLLHRHGADWSRTVLVEDSLEHVNGDALGRAHRLRPAAVALLDCRAAPASEAALGFLAGRLMDRSLLLLEAADKPSRRVFGEMLAQSSLWRAEPMFDYGPIGTLFSIRRRAAAPRRDPDDRELVGAPA